MIIEIIVLIDFNSTKQGLPLVDFSHVASTEIKCILIVICLSDWAPLGLQQRVIKVWWEMTSVKTGNKTASFLFSE